MVAEFIIMAKPLVVNEVIEKSKTKTKKSDEIIIIWGLEKVTIFR